MANLTFEKFLADYRQEVEILYLSSGAPRWSVSLDAFARSVWQGVNAAAMDLAEIPQILKDLRAQDLALAVGCAQGNEDAWEVFSYTHRTTLYEAACALAPDLAQARELSDSLAAELYGVDSDARGRRSLFAYFHGRSTLKTWLRAVVYQKFVNEYRRQSRLAPLPEELPVPAESGSSVSEQDDQRYAQLLSEAVGVILRQLPAPEKLLLAYYYVQQLTLKQIGRLTGEHEATVSRHLEALRKKLRKQIEEYLRKVKKLAAFDVDRCLDFASRGVTVDLEKALKPE